MRVLPAAYINASKEKVRDIFVQIKIKDAESTVLSMDKLYPIDIKRTITDGSFGVGFSSSDRITFAAATTEKIAKKTRITLYNSFGGEYERLGRFYCEESVRNGNMIEVTAFDAMNILRERTVKFTGIPSKDIAELSFPCKMQDMLDYIVAKNGLTCKFTCEDFTVEQKPMKNETEYYSDAEILGFIASAHAKNAKFDYEGELVFPGFSQVDVEFSANDVIDMTIDDSEPFEVKGILFSVGDDVIYIDDVAGSEYDEEASGIIKIENPLATVEIAEYVWNQLGGLKYYGGSLTVRGSGLLECGDVIIVNNLKDPSDKTEYPICITSISYSIDADGFIEKISSDVSKSKGKSLSSGKASSGGGGDKYYAGPGLSLAEGNVFVLDSANNHDVGGIRLDISPDVLDSDQSNNRNVGIYKGAESYPHLRTASSTQKGGMFLGDGLSPILEKYENYLGGISYRKTGYVQLRLGEGLGFVDNDESVTDPMEIEENSTSGRKVSVKIDGKTLVTGDGKIKVNIDEETIKLNKEGKLEAKGLTIEKGIIIQEADAKYLLHEYTEVEYIAGNKIGYAGAKNPVIMQNIPVCEFGAKTPNGVILPTVSTDVDTSEQLPGIQTYTTLNFPNGLYIGNAVVTKLALEPIAFSTTATDWQFKYYYADGTTGVYETFTTDNRYPTGFFIARNVIVAPNEDYPYGYATVRYGFIYAIYNSTQYRTGINTQYLYTLPFSSETEYNAAVVLTYEPVSLTEVTEKITEV